MVMQPELTVGPVAATEAFLSQKHVVVLLALHNGEKCLPDQLYSLKHQNHGDWSLIVSDDASADAGPDLVRCFARAEPERRIALIEGPNRGFAANFLHLLRCADPDAPYVAFCDQDDAWLPEKLAHGLAQLALVEEGRPALYCGRTWICGPTLRKLRPSPLFADAPRFSNAIVQNIGGGNTMLCNRAALQLLQAASVDVDSVASHDWWVYQMISGAGGRVIYDQQPMVLYRQHGDNVLGAGDNARAVLRRLGMVLRGQFQKWNDTNVAALNRARALLTPENRSLLDHFRLARSAPIFERIACLWRSDIRHQTRLGNAGLWLAAVLNRI